MLMSVYKKDADNLNLIDVTSAFVTRMLIVTLNI